MGGAFTAVADNADAGYWNPAGLGNIKDNEVTTMQTRLSTDADHYYVSYVAPALGGTIGVSWIQVGLGTLTQTSAEVDVNNEVVNLSAFSYFSNAYLFSYGRQLNKNISFGLTAKYLTSDMTQISGGQAYGYSVTPGIIIRLRSPASGVDTCLPAGTAGLGSVTVGLKIDELFNEQKWGTGTTEQAPPKLRLGLAYKMLNPGLIAVDIAQTLRSGYSTEMSVGYEWAKDGLSLRAGLAEGSLSAGAGFESGQARLDYAYVTQTDLSRSNVHRISLSGKW